jgi:hypothetical protein
VPGHVSSPLDRGIDARRTDGRATLRARTGSDRRPRADFCHGRLGQPGHG